MNNISYFDVSGTEPEKVISCICSGKDCFFKFKGKKVKIVEG
ncbi:hypothetical protein [Clostridium butyricum]